MATFPNNNRNLKYDTTRTGFEKFRGYVYDRTLVLLKHLNAQATVKIHGSFGLIDANGQPQGFFKDIFSGDVDFVIHSVLLRFWKVQTYPLDVDGVCMVSLNVPINYGEKLLHIFILEVSLFFAVLCCALTITLKCLIAEKSLSVSILEFLRMFVNAASLREPVDASKRMGFLVLVVLIFITNSFIMSKLSSMTAVSDYYGAIDSVDDLFDQKLPIRGFAGFKAFLDETGLGKLFLPMKTDAECTDRLLKGERIVCIPKCAFAKYGVYEQPNIHVSKNKLVFLPAAFATSVDWPLYSKINQLSLGMSEAGLNSLFDRQEQHHLSQKLWKDNEYTEISINIQDLYYGFYLFLGGYTTAICGFLVEILNHKCKKMLRCYRPISSVQRKLASLKN